MFDQDSGALAKHDTAELVSMMTAIGAQEQVEYIIDCLDGNTGLCTISNQSQKVQSKSEGRSGVRDTNDIYHPRCEIGLHCSTQR